MTACSSSSCYRVAPGVTAAGVCGVQDRLVAESSPLVGEELFDLDRDLGPEFPFEQVQSTIESRPRAPNSAQLRGHETAPDLARTRYESRITLRASAGETL